MKSIVLIVLALMLIGCGTYQPIVIREPTTPRLVIKQGPAGSLETKDQKESYFEASRPDLTRGYIEINSRPFLPEVRLLLKDGQEIFLIGSQEGPPKISFGQIIEFNLWPGKRTLRIYRWFYAPYYGGWQKSPEVEIVRISVAGFPLSGSAWSKGHYGWSVVIGPYRSFAYAGYIH